MKINIFLMLTYLILFDLKINCMNLLSAVKKNDITQARILLNHSDVNVQDKRGNTPLHVAAQQNNRPILLLLLTNPKIIVDKSNKMSLTPFHVAYLHSNKLAIYHLIQRGANYKKPLCMPGFEIDPSTNWLTQNALSQISLFESMLALTMGLHARVGAHSPAKILLNHLFYEIFNHLKASTIITKTSSECTESF